jgi:ribosome-associated translation inhibitor RaiA
MNLSERLNVLIQAITLSQKNGGLDLNDAVSAKYAIDVISSGVLNATLTSAINTLIEIIISSQKKGIYSLKDAHMIYVAIEGIENELQNEVNKLNEKMRMKEYKQPQVLNKPVQQIVKQQSEKPVVQPIQIQENKQKSEEVIIVPPIELKTL